TLTGFENLTGSAFDDHLAGDGGANVLSGGDGLDVITAGGGNDTLDGGSNIDTAVFSGAMGAYTITSSGGTVTVTGPDGTDTLTNIELLQFSDQIFHFRPGSGTTVNFAATPSTYAGALRDFDGNDLGGSGAWVLAGHVDIQGDGDQEYILFNSQIGRWATIGPAAAGRVYFDDHSWAGDTRVVGIYIDPEVQLGHAALGGPNDSQRRFQNDLNIGNIKGILGAGDYNHDGLQEVYFSLTDGTAYLHAYMHADGNIQYANYQTQQQVTDYLTANGFTHTTWDGWF
ncbi:MAG: family beta-propeller repeat protein, partial [Caulobacteraceae bacterium]|nr:family beta-propeller repeat protein [Caulobacteraceae bacterium]